MNEPWKMTEEEYRRIYEAALVSHNIGLEPKPLSQVAHAGQRKLMQCMVDEMRAKWKALSGEDDPGDFWDNALVDFRPFCKALGVEL